MPDPVILDVPITDLPAATLPLTGAELVEVVQAGENRQAPASALGGAGAGSGDMTKAVYDSDNDGKVDAAEAADTLAGTTPSAAGLALLAAASAAAQLAALGGAPLASPALTGTPTAPTADSGTSTTQLATTAFVQAALAALINAAPGALDTLDELAAALGDDANFAATMTTALAGKQSSMPNATQAEMEAGAETALRAMSPLRIAQAIAALAAGGGDMYKSAYDADNDGKVDAAEAADTLAGTTPTAAGLALLAAASAAAQLAALGGAPLASPALTGTPTAPTAVAGTNTTQIATTAFVQSVVTALINAAPGALDTLDELAAALGDDANFAATMTTALAGKQPIDDELTALAGLVSAADRLPYFTGPGAAALATFTAAARTLLAAADAAAQRTAMGLGDAATKTVGMAAGNVPDAGAVREKLTAARSYYVRSDGSDSNTGLADSSGGAFLTIQRAVNTVAGLDIGIYDVTIYVRAGTWTQNVTLKSFVGSGTVTLYGDPSTPANVTIQPSSGVAVSASAVSGAWKLNGLKLVTTNNMAIQAFYAPTSISIANVAFGAVGSGRHMHISSGAQISVVGNYSITGAAVIHVSTVVGGRFVCESKTITITGTPAFTYFSHADNLGNQVITGCTFSGSATGQRYTATLNAVIYTGGGSTYLPGNTAGATGTGGQYA